MKCKAGAGPAPDAEEENRIPPGEPVLYFSLCSDWSRYFKQTPQELAASGDKWKNLFQEAWDNNDTPEGLRFYITLCSVLGRKISYDGAKTVRTWMQLHGLDFDPWKCRYREKALAAFALAAESVDQGKFATDSAMEEILEWFFGTHDTGWRQKPPPTEAMKVRGLL